MIDIMNGQQIDFANFMREHDLSYETNLTFSSFIPSVNLCDDEASFLVLESGLEEVLDPYLTTLPFIGPSSLTTSSDNTVFIMTF